MSDLVLILGAGASKHAGAPLMNDFLDTARRLWADGHLVEGEAEQAFGNVFDGIRVLQRVHSKSKLDIHNVESVFSAFEMAKTLRRFGDFDEEEIEELVASMKSLIAWTLEKTVEFPIKRRGERTGLSPDPALSGS